MNKRELYFTLNGERLPTKGTENLTMYQIDYLLKNIPGLELKGGETKDED